MPRPSNTVPTLAWSDVWAHREELLLIARRRCRCADDAEDAVHEAMVRAMERDDLDPERVGAWLTTVVVRLCIDALRERTYEPKRYAYTAACAVPAPSPETAACDRAEARWIGTRLTTLPERQQDVVRLRGSGLGVEEIAQRLGTSYKTTESLLSRARTTLRRGGVAGLLLGALRALRRPACAGAGCAVAAAAVAFTLAMPAPEAAPPRETASAAARPAKVTPAAHRRAPRPVPRRLAAPVRPPARSAVRGSSGPARPQRLVRPVRVGAAGVRAGAAGAERRRPDESVLTSVERCVREGIEISPSYVGCRSAQQWDRPSVPPFVPRGLS